MLYRFLLLLFVALISTPASGQLQYRATSHHAAVWQKFYDQMPLRWKAKSKVHVSELYPIEMQRFSDDMIGLLPTGVHLLGLYEPNGDYITLAQSMNEDREKHVFLHEYGHYVFAKLMTSKERHDFNRIWESHISFPLTGYATTNVDEGFAEAFSFFLHDPEYLQDIDYSMYEFILAVRDGRR